MSVRFRILGPVEAWVEGRALPLGGARARTVLAVLLLSADRVVSTDRLIDDVWGDDAPPTVRGLVHSYMSRLRAQLRSASAAEVVATRPGGYALCLERGQLDLHVFEDLVEASELDFSEGRGEAAADRLREALALWRGPALAGIDADAPAHTAAARLEERRIAVLERRIEMDLHLGRHGPVLAELSELVALNPLRERLVGLLMLALYRSGRQADSLRVYAAARERLLRELGVEPEPGLRDLERQIRSGAQEPPAAVGPAGAAAPVPPSRAPCLLPPDIGDFTGRAGELSVATGALVGEGRDGVPVVALSGSPGVGKTTLAVHLAHLLRDRFPGGQLFVDLGGIEGLRLEPAQVHAAFLRALGVDNAAIPHDGMERAALYRGLLTGRRVLIVLDNAADESQVRPLLPGSPGCAVIVSSRATLGGLEAVEAMRLDVLEPAAGLELLARVTGRVRVMAEPPAARAIVDLCGGLPLAVRIAGARLRIKPHWRLDRLVARLRDERRRLDELRIGDLEVRASLALSYRGLDDTARRAFRCLSLLRAPDFPVWQAAALVDLDLTAAEGLLERLVDAQLLQAAGEDGAGQLRYRLHSLVRAFAMERALEHDPPRERVAAVERVLAAQLALGRLARAAASPGDASLSPRGSSPQMDVDPSLAALASREPVILLEAEREDLRAAVEMACAVDLHELAWELACSLPTFLALRGYWQDWRATKLLALEASRRAGNRAGVAHLVYALGMSALAVGDVPGARQRFEECMGRYRELNDALGERRTLLSLGLIASISGQHDVAARRYRTCLRLFREADEWYGAALALHGLADVQRRRGQLAEAAGNLERCLQVFRTVGEPYWEASVLRVLGDVARRCGRLGEAVGRLERCLEIATGLHDSPLEAHVLYRLSEIHQDRGHIDAAIDCLERCIAVASAQHFRDHEAKARRRLQAALVAGRH